LQKSRIERDRRATTNADKFSRGLRSALKRKSTDVVNIKIENNCFLSQWFRIYWMKHFVSVVDKT
jgi:hypothetical protein